MTTVKVELKYVRNLGNYESVHVGLGVEDTVRQDEKTVEAMDRVYRFVERELENRVNEISAELKATHK